jgi:hypothetical protein
MLQVKTYLQAAQKWLPNMTYIHSLDLQIYMQLVPIITNVVRSNPTKVYLIQHYM